MENGRAVLEGTYQEIFKSCDAIINDSISFATEILYVQKPMFFLKSDGNTFNDFGKELCQIHTRCYGDDFAGIGGFLLDIINETEDSKYIGRKEFFDRYLDYVAQNGCLASEFIYHFIKDAVTL